MITQKQANHQHKGRERKKPGELGEGDYYHIAVRPKEEFVMFRTHDVGDPGHIQRVAGKRKDGSWDDQTWLISKDDAHREGERLVPDTTDAQDVLAKLGSPPKHTEGDRFTAQP